MALLLRVPDVVDVAVGRLLHARPERLHVRVLLKLGHAILTGAMMFDCRYVGEFCLRFCSWLWLSCKAFAICFVNTGSLFFHDDSDFPSDL